MVSTTVWSSRWTTGTRTYISKDTLKHSNCLPIKCSLMIMFNFGGKSTLMLGKLTGSRGTSRHLAPRVPISMKPTSILVPSLEPAPQTRLARFRSLRIILFTHLPENIIIIFGGSGHHETDWYRILYWVVGVADPWPKSKIVPRIVPKG